MTYYYMVAYNFQSKKESGVGRMFVSLDRPIDHRDTVEAVDEEIKRRNPEFTTVFTASFQLLRSEDAAPNNTAQGEE